MADVTDSKSVGGNTVGVQVPSAAPNIKKIETFRSLFSLCKIFNKIRWYIRTNDMILSVLFPHIFMLSHFSFEISSCCSVFFLMFYIIDKITSEEDKEINQ